MVKRGRSLKGDKSPVKRHPEKYWGENNWKCKLTDAQALEIKAKYIPHVMSLHMLAREYGVSFSAIAHIIKGRTRKHLTS